jgi:hypothetical protein
MTARREKKKTVCPKKILQKLPKINGKKERRLVRGGEGGGRWGGREGRDGGVTEECGREREREGERAFSFVASAVNVKMHGTHVSGRLLPCLCMCTVFFWQTFALPLPCPVPT